MTSQYQSFLQNPGFRVYLNENETKVRANVQALDLPKQTTDFPSLSIAIYEIE